MTKFDDIKDGIPEVLYDILPMKGSPLGDLTDEQWEYVHQTCGTLIKTILGDGQEQLRKDIDQVQEVFDGLCEEYIQTELTLDEGAHALMDDQDVEKAIQKWFAARVYEGAAQKYCLRDWSGYVCLEKKGHDTRKVAHLWMPATDAVAKKAWAER